MPMKFAPARLTQIKRHGCNGRFLSAIRCASGPSCYGVIMHDVSIIERAFQLAGQCSTILEVKAELKKEGYAQVEAHLSGRKIRSELGELLKRDREDSA